MEEMQKGDLPTEIWIQIMAFNKEFNPFNRATSKAFQLFFYLLDPMGKYQIIEKCACTDDVEKMRYLIKLVNDDTISLMIFAMLGCNLNLRGAMYEYINEKFAKLWLDSYLGARLDILCEIFLQEYFHAFSNFFAFNPYLTDTDTLDRYFNALPLCALVWPNVSDRNTILRNLSTFGLTFNEHNSKFIGTDELDRLFDLGPKNTLFDSIWPHLTPTMQQYWLKKCFGS